MNNTDVLKVALAMAKKRAEESPKGGLKLQTGFKISNANLVNELERLVDLSESNSLREIGTCETCECITFTHPLDEKSQCYPQAYTSWRKRTDHCALYKRRK